MRGTIAVAIAAVMAAACGSSPAAQVSTSPTSTTPPVVAVEAKTVKGQVESVLVNASAQTLYYLTADTATTVACSGQCATFWPPLLLPAGDPTSGMALPGKLTVLADANGRQVLYNGHPLYAFVKDKASGDANGEGVTAFGGTWHSATPSLAAM